MATDAAVLFAAMLWHLRVYKLGGAQAIAAMAFGTGSVPAATSCSGWQRVRDRAKRRVSMMEEGRDHMPAGPSSAAIVDAGANPAFVASDLLSGRAWADLQVVLISDDDAMLDAVTEWSGRLPRFPREEIARTALSSP
jgi:histidinol dehydrogenase